MPKVIKSRNSDPEPTRFPFFELLDAESKLRFLQIARKVKGQKWEPDEVIEIESEKEIAKLMKEKPKGKQAIVSREV